MPLSLYPSPLSPLTLTVPLSLSSFSSHCPPLSLLFLLLIIASAEYLKGGGRRVKVCFSKGMHDTLTRRYGSVQGNQFLTSPFPLFFFRYPCFLLSSQGRWAGSQLCAGRPVCDVMTSARELIRARSYDLAGGRRVLITLHLHY